MGKRINKRRLMLGITEKFRDLDLNQQTHILKILKDLRDEQEHLRQMVKPTPTAAKAMKGRGLQEAPLKTKAPAQLGGDVKWMDDIIKPAWDQEGPLDLGTKTNPLNAPPLSEYGCQDDGHPGKVNTDKPAWSPGFNPIDRLPPAADNGCPASIAMTDAVDTMAKIKAKLPKKSDAPPPEKKTENNIESKGTTHE
jgi:hypothetical protein